MAPAPAGAPPSSSSPQPDLLLLTRNGLVKRTALSQFAKVRSNGTYAIKLRAGAGDELVWVARCPAPRPPPSRCLHLLPDRGHLSATGHGLGLVVQAGQGGLGVPYGGERSFNT